MGKTNKPKGITVKKFYKYITSKMTAEKALMKLLEGSLIQYEKLKFDDQSKAVHPIIVISMAAMDMGWQIAIEKKEKDIKGLVVGTAAYMKRNIKSKK